jgi:hypothetical protein
MIKLICAVSLLTVVVMNSVAAAGDIVEVRVLVDDRANPDSKQPALPVEPPKDAKVVLSIESLIGADGDFHAKCVIDGETIRLKGRAHAPENGYRRVSIEFSQQGKEGSQQVSTNVMLERDRQQVIGGLSGSDRLTAVRIKADDSEAKAKAE